MNLLGPGFVPASPKKDPAFEPGTKQDTTLASILHDSLKRSAAKLSVESELLNGSDLQNVRGERRNEAGSRKATCGNRPFGEAREQCGLWRAAEQKRRHPRMRRGKSAVR
jgi:hypothetical protein